MEEEIKALKKELKHTRLMMTIQLSITLISVVAVIAVVLVFYIYVQKNLMPYVDTIRNFDFEGFNSVVQEIEQFDFNEMADTVDELKSAVEKAEESLSTISDGINSVSEYFNNTFGGLFGGF